LQEAGADMSADKWVYVEGADASSNGRSIPMEKALDDVLVAFKANGEALRMEHGYPVRLVVPGWEGNMWVKWIRRIEIVDRAVESREETSKYTDVYADGTARKWTWVMDAKSVITSPSPQMPITHGTGPLVISGLAWSGHGQITRVDVSKDGGITWETARCCCKPARWTKPAMSNRPKISCASSVAKTPFTTTIVSRLGTSAQKGSPRMSKSPNLFIPAVGGTALLLGLAYGISGRDYGEDKISALEARVAQVEANASAATAKATAEAEKAATLELQIAEVQEAAARRVSSGADLTAPAPAIEGTLGIGRDAHEAVVGLHQPLHAFWRSGHAHRR